MLTVFPSCSTVPLLSFVEASAPRHFPSHNVLSLPYTNHSQLSSTQETSEPSKLTLTTAPFRNGASIPPRLPSLSSILRSLNTIPSQTTYTILALSYRGFWTSSGRPSEAGIKLDAAAALSWAAENFPPSTSADKEDVRFVLWGQSLGAGVAVDAAATVASRFRSNEGDGGLGIDGLLLETPFVGVKAMLLELYPQKWLPYRYLGPFLRNHWKSREALRRLASCYRGVSGTANMKGRGAPKLLILQAGKDELVPATQGLALEACAREVGLDVRRIEVQGALHNEVVTRASGKAAITKFLKVIGDLDCEQEKI